MELKHGHKTQSVQALTSQATGQTYTPPPFKISEGLDIIFPALELRLANKIAEREREYVANTETSRCLKIAAAFLSDPGSHFGMLIHGEPGNGKTCLAKAIRKLLCEYRQWKGEWNDFVFATAKQLAAWRAAKPELFEQYRNAEMLVIDDMGQEPARVMHYGNEYEPVNEIICHRYERRLFTIITTNLGADEIQDKYDLRVRDRLREMCVDINFGNKASFR